MKAGNPFTLMFGRSPQTLIARAELTSVIVEGFCAESPIYQTYLISGVRGSGKTVLMTNIEKELKEHGDWIIVDLNSAQDLIEDLAMRLSDVSRKMPNYLEKEFDLTAFGLGIGVGGTDIGKDNISIIEKLLEYAKKKKKKVLITIDEVCNNKSMRILASQFQIFVRKDYPVFMIMTGLYENIYSVQNDPALTFLLRSPKAFLEPLSERQIAAQYAKLLKVERETAVKFAGITKGYAFAFQAFGMLYFEHSGAKSLKQIQNMLADILDEFVYSKIWSSLSGNEQKIILSLSDSKSCKTSDICDACGISPQSFSQYRDRLLKKGIINSPKHGYIAVALPCFVKVCSEYTE